MTTNKPFTTISYNTVGFLTRKLDTFIQDGYISFYALYPHKGEGDEGGKKDHIHLYIEPNRKVDTQALFSELEEIDILVDKFLELDPTEQKMHILKCMPARTSSGKFDHWYMYSQHNPQYLKAKNLVKKFFYKAEDCITNDTDYLNFLVQQIEPIALTPYQTIIEAINSGLEFHHFVAKGQIPIPLIKSYEKVWSILDQHISHKKWVAKEAQKDYNPYSTSNIGKVSQIVDDDTTWCGATYDEWKKLYESATLLDG